jgi:hypothetical protein
VTWVAREKVVTKDVTWFRLVGLQVITFTVFSSQPIEFIGFGGNTYT